VDWTCTKTATCDAGAVLGPPAAGEVLGALEADVERAFLGEHVPDGEPRGALDEACHLDVVMGPWLRT